MTVLRAARSMDRHGGLAERISRKKKISVKIDDKVRIIAGILKAKRYCF